MVSVISGHEACLRYVVELRVEPASQREVLLGSGVVLSPDHVLTTRSVLEGVEAFSIRNQHNGYSIRLRKNSVRHFRSFSVVALPIAYPDVAPLASFGPSKQPPLTSEPLEVVSSRIGFAADVLGCDSESWSLRARLDVGNPLHLAGAGVFMQDAGRSLCVGMIPIPAVDDVLEAHTSSTIVDLFTRELGLHSVTHVVEREPERQIALPHDPAILTVSEAVGRELIAYFAENPDALRTMPRREFESLVAELWDGFGYDVELTRRTRDGGKDIIALRNTHVEQRYLIECKRPDPGNKIQVATVRELLGVKHDDPASKAILATTSHFTRDAQLFIERNRWELEGKDFDGVLGWIREYLNDSATL